MILSNMREPEKNTLAGALTMRSTKGFLKAASAGKLPMKGEEGELDADRELLRERELALQVSV